MDEAAKKLIGDIAPKPIALQALPPPPSSATGPGAGSAWNAAGTYEEVVLTPWATAFLKERLEAISVRFAGGSVSVKALPPKKKSKKDKDKESDKDKDKEDESEVRLVFHCRTKFSYFLAFDFQSLR